MAGCGYKSTRTTAESTWVRIEGSGRDACLHLRLSVNLHAQRQQAQMPGEAQMRSQPRAVQSAQTTWLVPSFQQVADES